MSGRIVVLGMMSPEGTYGLLQYGRWNPPWDFFLAKRRAVRFIELFSRERKYESVAVMFEEHVYKALFQESFPNYINIVITESKVDGAMVKTYSTFDEAFRDNDVDAFFVLGGEVLWDEVIPKSNEVIVTVVNNKIERLGENYRYPEMLDLNLSWPKKFIRTADMRHYSTKKGKRYNFITIFWQKFLNKV